jgi:hypothetical protein
MVNGETWPACGDIDGDEKDEILIGLGKGGGGSVEIFDFVLGQVKHKEWLILDWADYNEINGETRPVCGDIDVDDKDEIIVGLGRCEYSEEIEGGRFAIIDDDYSVLGWGQVDWDDYNEINGETRPACGDVDFDSKDEIIIGLGQGGEGRIEICEYKFGKVFHKKWKQVSWRDYSLAVGETRPTCGNIDMDIKDEIIIGLGRGGAGHVEIYDDVLNAFKTVAQVQVQKEGYTVENGETWCAVKEVKKSPPWIEMLEKTLKQYQEKMQNSKIVEHLKSLKKNGHE